MVDVSIVIVNYKSKGFTLNCLKSIKDSNWHNLKYEVIVVDNNSDDSIGEILSWQNPEVKFIQNKINLGMGEGNNVGIRKAEGKYIAVINPDTLVNGDSFLKLYNYMEANPEVGAVGPQLLNPDKTVQPSCFRWYGLMTPIYRRTPLGRTKSGKKDIARFVMNDFDHKTEKKVDWLMGSFLFCRAEALKEIGMFDKRFFMYFEDTDLCKKFWRNKYKVVYYPEVKVIHNHTRQSAQIKWYKFILDKSARWHIVSWLKYLMKWGLK